MLLAGIRVRFVADAAVYAEMPTTLQNSHTQNVRWEQGRLEMARIYVPKLLRAALSPPSARFTLSGRLQTEEEWHDQRILRNSDVSVFTLLDAVVEHIIPPFAILAGLTFLYGVGVTSIMMGHSDRMGLWLTLYLFLGQSIYLLSGLILTQAPRQIYLAFFYIPKFILWKAWLYIRVLLKIEEQGWVRTMRNDSTWRSKYHAGK